MSLYHFLYNPYYLIFHNSLQSAVALQLIGDNAWLAALTFGNYNMVFATALAFLGSVMGMSLVYGFGFYISRWRSELPNFSERFYQRLCGIFRKKLFVIMALPPILVLDVMPLLPLYVIVNGMFRVPPARAIAAIMLSRILYYGYYLLF
jgi:membrane protein YqaA with SNARE-associated domain